MTSPPAKSDKSAAATAKTGAGRGFTAIEFNGGGSEAIHIWDPDLPLTQAYRDLFRKEYPKVKLTAGSILNLSFEAEGVITAGGVTAWQDLALHVIARLCGTQHALRTSLPSTADTR